MGYLIAQGKLQVAQKTIEAIELLQYPAIESKFYKPCFSSEWENWKKRSP